jgi:hypothetical protein
MKSTRLEGMWYPGELAPHLFYIHGELSGMAAAVPRIWGESQKWEAFDMRPLKESATAPVLLGEHENLELAKLQIEKAVLIVRI